MRRIFVAILTCLQFLLGASVVSFAASAPAPVEIKAGGFGGDAVSSCRDTDALVPVACVRTYRDGKPR